MSGACRAYGSRTCTEGGKGFWGSLPQASTGGGLMLASIALGLVSLLPEQALFSWGWRLPFLASIILLAVGWYIRVKVPESPDFEKVKQQSEEVKVPAFQVLKPSKTTYHHYRKCMVLYCFNFYASLHHHTIRYSTTRHFVCHYLRCSRDFFIMTPLCGHLSDKVDQHICLCLDYVYWHFILIHF